LTIENYRSFDKYQLNGLARVNLLVGDNNCGKTSVLEAVQLFLSDGDGREIFHHLDARDARTPMPLEPGTRLRHLYQLDEIFFLSDQGESKEGGSRLALTGFFADDEMGTVTAEVLDP